MAKAERPLVIFDADCGFCTRSIEFVRHKLPVDAEFIGYQFVELPKYGLTADRASHEVLWVDPSGRIDGGAEAFASLLRNSGGWYVVPATLLRIPPFRWVAHGIYRLIADNRHRMPGGTAACALPNRG